MFETHDDCITCNADLSAMGNMRKNKDYRKLQKKNSYSRIDHGFYRWQGWGFGCWHSVSLHSAGWEPVLHRLVGFWWCQSLAGIKYKGARRRPYCYAEIPETVTADLLARMLARMVLTRAFCRIALLVAKMKRTMQPMVTTTLGV